MNSIRIDMIKTSNSCVFDAGDDEESCIFADEEHAQIYALILELKAELTQSRVTQQKAEYQAKHI